MSLPLNANHRTLRARVRLGCIVVFIISTLLPPYVPKAYVANQEVHAGEQQFLLVEDGFLMKTSSLTDRGARRAYTKGHVHVVKSGETLESLARRYTITLNTLRWANGLEEGQTIHPGDELIILPVDGVLHTVKRGQNLLQIADLYEIPLDNIVQRNDLSSEFLLAGQQLIIPGGEPVVQKPTTVAVQPQPTPQQPSPSVPKPTPKPPIGQPVAVADDLTQGVLQKPCSAACFLTQGYHAGHYALDLQERGGGPIFAAEAGTIIRADYGWNGGYGNVIEIDHGNGLVTLYGHNKEIYVSEGELVNRGQKIADMGNTGLVYGKTGIHVHFEVRLKGVKKNPNLYIQ